MRITEIAKNMEGLIWLNYSQHLFILFQPIMKSG
jgi:hypothetical protein